MTWGMVSTISLSLIALGFLIMCGLDVLADEVKEVRKSIDRLEARR